VVVEVRGRDTAEPEKATPMDKIIAALETFGSEGARATEWERKCAELGGPKSGSFYSHKEQAVGAGRVTEDKGRFFVAVTVAANDNAPTPVPTRSGVQRRTITTYSLLLVFH
jgi:hypothetical protein